MTNSTPAGEAAPPGSGQGTDRAARRASSALFAVVAVIVVVLVARFVTFGDDRADTTNAGRSAPAEPTTSSPSASTSAAPTSTFVSGTLNQDERAVVVFPDDTTSRRFDDPRAAALAFATEIVGFREPLLGQFAGADPLVGEVPLRAAAEGPVTTVLVRQFGAEGSWWVVGATTPDIVIDQPAPGAEITSPMQVSGRALTSESAVEALVLTDGAVQPLVSGSMSRSAAEPAVMSGQVTYPVPDRQRGALVLRARSDGGEQVWQATVVRVAFADFRD